MINKDWGEVFRLDGAEIVTTYEAPASVSVDQYGARAPRRRWSFLATLDPATAITAVTAKVQASYDDGETWRDVASFDDAGGGEAVEQTYNTVISDTISGGFYVDGGHPLMRVAIKVAGGDGVEGESIAVSQLDTAQLGLPVEAAQIEANAVTGSKIQDAAVTEGKIDDAAVTTDKLDDEAVTAAKLDDAALVFDGFTGRNGAGACTLTGAQVGDKVQGIVNLTDGGSGTAAFESTITVADEIQQSSASDLSSKKYSLLLLKRGA